MLEVDRLADIVANAELVGAQVHLLQAALRFHLGVRLLFELYGDRIDYPKTADVLAVRGYRPR